MIFGSTTEVGKTIVSAGLCRAALKADRRVCYVKPIQTGELDEYFVQFYANPKGVKEIVCRTIYHWQPALSPYLAAQSEGYSGTDAELVRELRNEISVFENSSLARDSFTVVETAGGVLSPGPSNTLQADMYRKLRLPIILVGESKLGGITTTLSAVESLRLRGYTIHAVIMIQTKESLKYGNVKSVQDHLSRAFCGIPGDSSVLPAWSDGHIPKVFSLSELPPRDKQLLNNWFADNDDVFKEAYDHIDHSIAIERAGEIDMLKNGPDVMWWPFTQHGVSNIKSNLNFIESAFGDNYRVLNLQPIDPSTSKSSLKKPDNESKANANAGESKSALPDKALGAEEEDSASLLDVHVGQSEYMTISMEEVLDGSASWWTQVRSIGRLVNRAVGK